MNNIYNNQKLLPVVSKNIEDARLETRHDQGRLELIEKVNG